MMYRYEIEFVTDRGDRGYERWNCTCNSIETTLRMAKGACNRNHAKYGAIKIFRESGSLVKVYWFDYVLN